MLEEKYPTGKLSASYGASQYHQEMKIPIRIIKNTKMILDKPQKEKKPGSLKHFLKKAGSLVLILSIFLSQALVLSAFEAHVINVTAHICTPLETRTPGFWKTHPEVYVNYLPQYLGNEIIDTEEKADEVFKNANADEMRDQLKSHLLAMKFNIMHFGIGNYFVESEGKTIYEIVVIADDILKDPNSTREEQEAIKNVLDYLNNLGGTRQCLGATFAFEVLQPVVFEPFWLTDDGLSLESQLAQVMTSSQEEPPIEEPPVEEPPADETPPTEEPPIEEPPLEEPPVEEPPVEEPPAEEPPAEETSPAEEPPVEEESPIEEPPLEETPTEEPPAEESPVEEEPPAEEPPAEEPPAEEPSVEEPSAEETPAEEPSAEEPPVEEPPTEEPPVEEPPTEEPPVEEPPAEEPPVEEPPVEEPPAESPPAEEPPVE